MPISRRSFLIGGASALVLAACSSGDDDAAPTTTAATIPSTTTPKTPLSADPFGLGIASGDPDSTSVVLWTRLMGADGEHDVVWEVLDGERLVAAGVERTGPDVAHTVHAIADGLDADTEYRYRFRAGEFTSPVGRTRTTPKTEGSGMRFAFASCQDWQDGLYTAHAHLAEEDVDLVVFLGDYIYESGIASGTVRAHDADEVITLDDYRARYALYKSDPNLQAAHARAPWFVIWDDHEVDNNYAAGSPEIGAPDVDFAARRAAGYRAWWEHQPTRLPPPDASGFTTYRTLEWGGLATFFGLDGRSYRDDQPCDADGDLGAGCDEREDPARTMLGAEQEQWLEKNLTRSRTTWNVLANQTIFSPSGIPVGPIEVFNLDQWDGYPAARDRLLPVLASTSNPVIVTGDIHASAVADVKHGDQVVAVELVGTSISSGFPAAFVDLFEDAAANAGAKMADAKSHGYVVCDVTTDSFRADYRVVSTVQEETASISTASSWEIAAGTPGVQPVA